ncbi:MAG TPA: helix-turn-helix domain-containing protein [Trebonia sp.]|nr:helix-turn-helix domain-containing protein [Trebonia sp.]
MSLIPRRARVLAGSAWPGREVDGYANLIAARLRKLAAARSTGTLPVSGPAEGAIVLRGGHVVHAESSRTPPWRTVDLAALGLTQAEAGPSPARAGTSLAGPSRAGEAVPEAAEPSTGMLAGLLAVTEPIIDAATELLSTKSRYTKFRRSDVPGTVQPYPIPVAALLAEAERRHRVLSQLAAVVTADTPVIRGASLGRPRLQVSAPQWALVVGMSDGMTPREVAMRLGRSVFATTIEAYRLVELGLLAVTGHPPPADGRGRALAFMRAVTNERGTDG